MLAAFSSLESVTAVVAANALLWFVSAAAAPVLTLLVIADAPETEWPGRIADLNRFQGFGWAGGLVLGMVWLWALTPELGSALTAQRWLFRACAACTAGAAAVAFRWLPESTTGLEQHERRRIGRILTGTHRNVRAATFAFAPNRLYWTTQAVRPRRLARRISTRLGAYFLAVALFSTGFAVFWAPLPAYLSTAGYGGGATFAMYLATSLTAALCYGGVGRLSGRFDVRLLQSSALGVRAGVFPLVALVGATGVLTAITSGGLFVVLGVTWAVIAVTSTAVVTRLAPASARGEALGVQTALVTAAGGVGGLLGGWLAQFGYLTAFGTAGAFVAAGAVAVASLRGLSTRAESGAATTPEHSGK
jgi:MFS family permease